MDMKKAIAGLCILFVLAAFAVTLEIVRELGRFETVHYEIETKKLKEDTPEMTIVFLSDLHNHEYDKKNQKLVQAIRDRKPDLILCTGDMLVGKEGRSFEPAAEFMKQLPQIAPVYYANGNHEQRMRKDTETYGDAYREYESQLKSAGVKFLINEKEQICWHGNKVILHGLEIPDACYKKLGHFRLKKEELTQRIGAPEEDAYHILLAHNPNYVPEYEKWGADLVLSGHLHGGMVRLPFAGGLVSPQVGFFPRYSGDCYIEGEKAAVVSKGLGTHTINVRLWNPAELIVIHVKAK